MTLTIIDTFGFLFRNFYALPPLKSKKGTPTGMITGFMNFIASLGKDFPTDYVVFTLDSKEKETFRKEIFKDYKANRPEAPEDLKVQLPIAIDLIKEMGFKMIEIPGYESDDIIASLAKKAASQGIKVKIVSHDKDMYQLIDDDKIVIFDPIKKIEINEEKCMEKFGVHPKDFRDFQALVGDSSDNIPGVKGVGVKTAAKLINQYQTLENIYEHIDEIKGALKKKLIEGKENAFLSRELVTLKTDLFDKNLNLEEFKYPEYNPILKVADKLIDLDITSIIERVKKEGLFIKTKEPNTQIEFEAVLIEDEKELFEVINSIPKDAIVAFDTETNSLENPEIVGFSFAWEEKRAYYVPINHFYLGVGKQIDESKAIEAIKELFKRKIVGHNLKFDLKMLRKYGVYLEPFSDTMILAWIIDPDSPVGLDSVAKRYLNHQNIKFKEIIGKKKDFSEVPIEEATKYAAEDALISLKLYPVLTKRLWDEVKWDLENIEIPFINLLIDMENEGIKLDIEYMNELKEKITKKLNELTKEIYELAGSEFNIKSPKQLSHILFEVLKLPAKKKTKTGYSTDEKVLNSLKNAHPIMPKLLEYRKLDKLLSTYVIPLSEYAKKDPNHKIYTNFVQTGTATGRLSSKNPNLQNIPTSTDINIRNAFVAQKEFVSLDYSQIELRLLAHFSEDSHLIEAFLNDKDIHLETAVKIFGAQNAKEYRSVAKSINFGLIYGMGPKKLSETINVSTKEAKEFIEKYFASFPTVKTFIEKTKLEAREKGYVETLFKRRRFFDFASANARTIANFEREAVNTIFQGSAADIIKKAMIEIKNRFPNSKMILQIHDELIFEIDSKDEAYEYQKIMQEVVKLKVPLKVGISFGKRWGELK
ncbi:DNA polymerase I [Caminibacter pacificus]|uniref:DNA polymerase I n=1 Tax=Caminibacter pacificus TaxID=1424653 RepID=A0AAJ4UY97_9BACT|nr:DNA polymerase I [Caminibacter pacificus]QCI28571.1 DNA polymerase I [Caminibacter pacificus]ROR40702.1 DNA polymerase I [Caminibacter pacificus]